MEPVLTKVHEDARGAMYSLVIGDRELMLLSSKAGSLRGGPSHDCDEVVLLLTGRMRYHKIVNGAEEISIKEPGDLTPNKAGEVHMGEFLEDSWVAEWKLDARVGESTTTDYEPFRALVRKQLA